MKNILKNKKTLVLTTMIGLMMIIVGFSAVIAKPPVDKTPDDDDWAGSGTGDMYNYYLEDFVGIGTTTPAYELDVNGVINASGGNSIDWNTAFGWGDHSGQNYLDLDTYPNADTDSTDDYSDSDIDGSESAFDGWDKNQGDDFSGSYGDLSGKPVNIDEDGSDDLVDSDFVSSGLMKTDGAGNYGIVSDNSIDWNTAFSWGDHALVGYDTTNDSWTGVDDVQTTGNVTIAIVSYPYVRLFVASDTGDQDAILGWTSGEGKRGVGGLNDDSNGYGVVGDSSDGTGVRGWSRIGTGVEGKAETETGFAGKFIGKVFINGKLGIGIESPNQDLDVANDIALGSGSSSDDDYLYFDDSAEYLKWNDGQNRFDISDDLNVDGDITTDKIIYSSPRTHYYSLGCEDFQPRTDVSYTIGGNGGAYIESGNNLLNAPVHLPHGATVTEFKVFFYNNSADHYMNVSLKLNRLVDGVYFDLAGVNSEKTGGSNYYTITNTTISSEIIDNTDFAYSVHAFSPDWDGSLLKIMGAVITYTIDEAL